MGYVRHNAIVATAWQEEAAAALVRFASEVGAEAVVGGERTNGYRTVVVTPDGSKEGWEASGVGDDQRRRIREWMSSQTDFYFEWCEVAYGDDDGKASVEHHAWTEREAG